jgi:DNA-binding transcriptional LysR family regulator
MPTTREKTLMSLGGTDLNLLNALKVLLEESNVTHAGRRLNMSQPAMSGALARLRREFGDELLVRNGRESELTPLAYELLPLVQDTVRLVGEALHVSEPFNAANSTRTFRLTLSDYALSVIYPPLMRRIREVAPGVRVEFADLADDARLSDRAILDYDVLVGPLGYGFPGTSEFLFRDRMVCIADRDNPRITDGALSVEDLIALPHAVASFGRFNQTPVDRRFNELGLNRRVQVTVSGWMALPFVIAGTEMIGVVPERLALQCAGFDRIVITESPFGEVELIEGIWYQQAKTAEAGQVWLISMLREVSGEIAASGPAASGG